MWKKGVTAASIIVGEKRTSADYVNAHFFNRIFRIIGVVFDTFNRNRR